jgi:hypothetical protein
MYVVYIFIGYDRKVILLTWKYEGCIYLLEFVRYL